MIGPLRPGSLEARLLYRIMAGEQLISFEPEDRSFVELTAEVVFRLMRIRVSPLVVWSTGRSTTELADELAECFWRLGDDPVIRPHDQFTGRIRHPASAHEGDSPDVIPMVESVRTPQQVLISHLAIFGITDSPLPQIKERCLSQVLLAGGPGRATSTALEFFSDRLIPASRLQGAGWARGGMPLEVALAGAPT